MKEIAMTGFIRFNGNPNLRWNPVAARHAVDVDRALETLASQMFGTAARTENTVVDLRADVRETATAYILQLDVPGVAKEDITVDVDEKTVRIEATFKRASTEPAEGTTGETAATVVLTERVNGAASRNFRLPQAVDAELATAHHEHGVLTLTLPKKNAATQKRLAIN
jgi:HSP20 family protein